MHYSRGFCGCSSFHDDFFLTPMEELAKHFDSYKVTLPRDGSAQLRLEPNDLWIFRKSMYIGLSERRMYERTLLRHPGLTRTR